MADSDISRVYADSLFEIADKNGSLHECEQELDFFCLLVREDNEFKVLINNPAISIEKKKAFIETVLGRFFCQDLTSFLLVLIEHERQVYIESINKSFIALLDEKANRQRVTITTCDKLDENLKKNIEQRLVKKLNKRVLLTERHDPSILGGVIVQIDDLVIDGSLVKELKSIKSRLLKREIRRDSVYEN